MGESRPVVGAQAVGPRKISNIDVSDTLRSYRNKLFIVLLKCLKNCVKREHASSGNISAPDTQQIIFLSEKLELGLCCSKYLNDYFAQVNLPCRTLFTQLPIVIDIFRRLFVFFLT